MKRMESRPAGRIERTSGRVPGSMVGLVDLKNDYELAPRYGGKYQRT